mmetsp:Transcript_28443/g.53208  ORF Transcript_28443/g.53208 Transcript_28443/m.53208 type:complete len:344 (-) Transcript_28443:19-1050(-)
MRRPKIPLRHFEWFQGHGVARHIPRLAGQFDHLRDQHIVKPRILLGQEGIDLVRQRLGIAHGAPRRVRLDRDRPQVKQPRGVRDVIDRVHKFPRYGIAGRQGKQCRLVFCNEPLQDRPRCREFGIQQRAFALLRAQQNKLPVHSVVVEVERVAEVTAHLGRKTGDVDIEIGEAGLFPRQMLQRTIVPLDQRRRGHVEQVAIHQPGLNEAHHVSVPFSIAMRAASTMQPGMANATVENRNAPSCDGSAKRIGAPVASMSSIRSVAAPNSSMVQRMAMAPAGIGVNRMICLGSIQPATQTSRVRRVTWVSIVYPLPLLSRKISGTASASSGKAKARWVIWRLKPR